MFKKRFGKEKGVFLEVLHLDGFKKELKKLKRHPKEMERCLNIIEHIKLCNNYEELKNNPLSKRYGFETLKYEMNGYHSFNLCFGGGVIRLICSVFEDDNIIRLEYISKKHYEDFKIKLKEKKERRCFIYEKNKI